MVTGCSPNHLDWHGSFVHYAATKQRILAGQTSEDCAVLNMLDPEAALWPRLVRGGLIVVGGEAVGTLRLPVPHTACADYIPFPHTACADYIPAPHAERAEYNWRTCLR